MTIYPAKIPFVLPYLMPSLIFKKDTGSKTVYLTFDDGPTPEVTTWLLNFLKAEQIKATFFWIGEKIIKNQTVAQQVIDAGHSIGNHTFNHKDAWKTTTNIYIEQVAKAENEIEKWTVSKHLFRPPYGHITPAKSKKLQAMGYKIIMWSIISGDFHPKLNTQKAIKYLSRQTQAGHILVFHDSRKSFKNLKTVLPPVVRHLKNQGFHFDIL